MPSGNLRAIAFPAGKALGGEGLMLRRVLGKLRRGAGALKARLVQGRAGIGNIRNDAIRGEFLSLVERTLYKDISSAERHDIQFFDRLYKFHGPLRSTANLSAQSKLDAELHFHFREKAEVALTVGSSWYGGDYFEFGAHDLNTFRNMLSAYDICGMARNYTDVRFYAFDIFGKLGPAQSKEDENSSARRLEEYFSPYVKGGDQIKLHYEYLKQHNLFNDKCFLVQGLFENTLTDEFKKKYKTEGRKIGFAFLDCNVGPSYKTVFEFIFDLVAENSNIYMDEYFQNPAVIEYFGQFVGELGKQRGIGSLYIRNAGGFGGLFRLYPLGMGGEQLSLGKQNPLDSGA